MAESKERRQNEAGVQSTRTAQPNSSIKQTAPLKSHKECNWEVLKECEIRLWHYPMGFSSQKKTGKGTSLTRADNGVV
ncbi:MAG: hypothetical protein DMG98_10300 [Acidobacteria bacterium]|nr:MAG: hypothetical protein DMG98_10300 [Acidobacteriota bacterium]